MAGSSERTLSVTWEDPVAAARAGARLTGIEHIRAIVEGTLPPPPIAKLLGFELVSAGEGRATFALAPGEQHYNPIGVVHGGVAATLLDSAMGCAVHSRLGATQGYTTLEIKVNYVRAVTRDSGRVTAEGSVVHLGRTTATAEGRLVDGKGKLLAHATTTCLVFERPAG